MNFPHSRCCINPRLDIKAVFSKFSYLIFFAFFSYLYLLFVNHTYAQIENFDISINSEYKINDEGTTNITNKIKLKNKTKYNFTSSFDISLQKINDIRNVRAYYLGNRIQTTLKRKAQSTVIEVNLGNRTYGENKSFEFSLEYETSQFAKKTGSFWEVFIPTPDAYDKLSNYNITITPPESFGPLSISKPEKILVQSGSYKFAKDDLDKAGVYLLFGSSQAYKINLDYHISNPNFFPIKSEVVIPPSTNYQDVIVKEIYPKPVYIYEDIDGNWLAVFQLSPHQKMDIKASLLAMVHTTPGKETLDAYKGRVYLEDKKYWEVNDTRIRKISQNLKTPDKIYDYVVKNLNYDFNKIIGENERLGAAKSLSSPNSALCLEYTDLFIALSRASKIPSRAVEGFAYSENSTSKPLSILKDTLHVWPEYYDNAKQTWIMIDPTWGSTTGGGDYFNSLDVNHVAFVINGKESDYPMPPGAYKTNPGSKDINVDFADPSEFNEIKNAQVSYDLSKNYLPLVPVNFNITITNKGNAAIKNEKIKVISSLSPNTLIIETGIIPPYGFKTFSVKLGNIPLLTNKNNEVKILFENLEYKKDIKIGFDNKLLIYITGGGIFGAFALFIAAFKTRRIHF